MRPPGGGAAASMSAAGWKMAAWRAALAAAARAPLRGRLAGLRPARSQRRPAGWRVAAAAAVLLGGGSVAACYGGWRGWPGAGAFLTVLAQVRRRQPRSGSPRRSPRGAPGAGAGGSRGTGGGRRGVRGAACGSRAPAVPEKWPGGAAAVTGSGGERMAPAPRQLCLAIGAPAPLGSR